MGTIVKPKKEVAVGDGREAIIEFLGSHGIHSELVDFNENDFSRTIRFVVYGIEYQIEWYPNESTLKIGSHRRSAGIPFKHIYFDDCYPSYDKNSSIGFVYKKLKRESTWDREFPYEAFRIPTEL